jgi:GH24 family phage-related lysozyme (muramidase)
MPPSLLQTLKRQQISLLLSGIVLVLLPLQSLAKENIMALFDINKYIEEQGSEEPVSSIMRPNTQTEEPDTMMDFYKRFSKSIYDAFPDKEKFRETFVKQRKTGINWDEVRRYTREADMQDAIQSSIEQALGIMPQQQEEEPEQPQGLTLVDVTDTDEGRLSNEAPLQELMSDLTEEKITKEELPAVGGLMSPRLDEKGKGPDKPQAPRNADEGFDPIEASKNEKTKEFYLQIGQKAESDHGSVPVPTKDAKEKNIPEAQRSKDVGFGHKVKASENASGMIHGIKFKNDDGTYIELTEDQKVEILNADMAAEADLARRSGWDKKLKKIGTSWEELDYKYRNALTSLAYNVGGGKAGKGWTAVLTAAKNGDAKAFAKEMRRKDAGRNTAGMDNRVAKELYYAGIIKNLSEVADVLPLADRRSGVPS